MTVPAASSTTDSPSDMASPRATSATPAAPGTSASLSLDGVGLSIELNGAQVAEVSSRSPMSDSSFSLTASTADVAVDRVTAKVRQ